MGSDAARTRASDGWEVQLLQLRICNQWQVMIFGVVNEWEGEALLTVGEGNSVQS